MDAPSSPIAGGGGGSGSRGGSRAGSPAGGNDAADLLGSSDRFGADGGDEGGGGGGASALAAAAEAAAAAAEAEADRRPVVLPSVDGPADKAGVTAASQATVLLKKRREARLLDEAVAQARARFARRSAALDARAGARDRRRAELEQMLVTLKPIIEVRAGAARGAGRRRWRARPRARKQPAR